MLKGKTIELAKLFRAVGQVMERNRQSLDLADPYNGNHGDHMVEIFQLATRAAEEKQGISPAETMDYAAELLESQTQNGSARMYASGLRSMAEQFRKSEITLEDMVAYLRGSLEETSSVKNGEVLKAMVSGLAAWGQSNNGQIQVGSPLNMGSLFEFGMAYIQAKQRGGSKIQVLANAAVSVSPLSKVPHRCQSGRIAIQALLQALQGSSSGLAE